MKVCARMHEQAVYDGMCNMGFSVRHDGWTKTQREFGGNCTPDMEGGHAGLLKCYLNEV